MDIKLLQKLGNIDQIAGIRETECMSGNARGLRMIEVYNAAGLRFTVVPDHCLDIYDFSYKGQNLAFHSKNGLQTAWSTAEDDFFKLWPGGMLSTCGLLNVGASCYDKGFHPIHGRIGSTPARHISINEGWKDDDYILSISGDVWETQLYGNQLSLHRTISTGLKDRSVTISDTITNHTMTDEEFMLLYHINFGYPLLDETSQLICSSLVTESHTGDSIYPFNMCAPGSEPGHQIFLHSFQGSIAKAVITNPALKIAGYVEYETTNLPYLCEWKHLEKHDYVIALEPCNCIGLGRLAERENHTLKSLPAYSSISQRFSIGVLEGDIELQAFIKN